MKIIFTIVFLYETAKDSNSVPVWIQIVSVVVTLILAILTTFFIYRQRKLEETKVRLEAYDRRLKIYNSIKIFISEIQTWGTTTNDKLVALLQETRESLFLFKDKEISNYINNLYKRGVDLEYIQNRLHKNMEHLKDEERMKLATQSRDLFQWFTEQHRIVEEKFEKYLRLK